MKGPVEQAHAAAEAQLNQLRNAIAQEHVNQFLQALDGLQVLVNVARTGNLGARQQLQMFLKALENARAAVAGIVVPVGPGGEKPGDIPASDADWADLDAQ